MKIHYIATVSPKSGKLVRLEYRARNKHHAKSMFVSQYPGWKIRWINTTNDTIALITGVVLTIGGLGVVSQLMPEADARTNTVENHAND